MAGVAIAALVISAVALGLPELWLQQRHDAYASRVFGPRALFCFSSDLIHQYVTTRGADPFSMEVTEALGRIVSPEARSAARDWAILGFNGDECFYGETAQIVTRHFSEQPSAEAAYYLATYRRALAAWPGYLPVRLARHVQALARRPFTAVATDYFVRADDSVIAAHRDGHPLLRRWLEQHGSLFSGVVELPTRSWLLGSRIFLAAAGPLLSALTVVALVAAAQWNRIDRTVAVSFVSVLMCAVATNLLIATIHTFEPRYVVMQMPMFTLLGFASLVSFDGLVQPRS